MIELIFALVIMGIVLMTAPMLINTAAKSGYVTIQQEAINEAASQVNMIMGYHWDENSADELYIDPILKVSSTSADSELDELNTTASPSTGRRAGTPKESYRAFIRSDGIRPSATTIPSTPNSIKNDVGDFNGEIIHLEDKSGGAAGDIDNIEKNTIDIAIAVKYIPDTTAYNSNDITFNYSNSVTATGTTNIKDINVTLTSSSGLDELDKEITLHAFSCNIGGYKLEEKDVN